MDDTFEPRVLSAAADELAGAYLHRLVAALDAPPASRWGVTESTALEGDLAALARFMH